MTFCETRTMSSNDPKMSNLISQGESSTIEYKLKLPPDHKVAADLAAFANTEGGVLIVGLYQRNMVVGLSQSSANEILMRLRRIASSLFSWPVEVNDAIVNGKRIVYAAVDPAPPHLAPVFTADGHVYVRQGATTRRLDQAEEQAKLRQTPVAPLPTAKRCRVFVAMSFREEEEPALVDYYRAFERAVSKLELPIDLVRIDSEERDYEISQEIMNQIDSCDIFIADFTLSPANVYFELGYARGRSKTIIQSARKDTALEFDVRNWRTEFYRNATELEERIGPALQAAYATVTGQT